MGIVIPLQYTKDDDFNQFQVALKSALAPLARSALFPGVILVNVALQSGQNIVSHTLGKTLTGWFIVRKRAAGDIFDTQDTNTSPDKTLNLTATQAMKVDLYVF